MDGGDLPKDGLPKNVREVKIEGKVAEFLIAIDFSDKKCLEESIDSLRNLADILSAGSHLSTRPASTVHGSKTTSSRIPPKSWGQSGMGVSARRK
jgi:hypothetical protein